MFTGFKAYCLIDGKEIIVEEKNNYFDGELKRICATNWHQVDKMKLKALELWWKGELKARVDNRPENAEWLFYHSATCSFPNPKPLVKSRTIGFLGNCFSVNEATGEVF